MMGQKDLCKGIQAAVLWELTEPQNPRGLKVIMVKDLCTFLTKGGS